MSASGATISVGTWRPRTSSVRSKSCAIAWPIFSGKTGLASLHAVQASDEVAAITYYLKVQFDAAGAPAVRTYLEEMAASRAQARLNSWSAVPSAAVGTSGAVSQK